MMKKKGKTKGGKKPDRKKGKGDKTPIHKKNEKG
jgi:hypothetical protein